jgi:predicted porin
MKKSLIAVAVLAASGAAMAQSSVILYGRLDVGFGQRTTETTGAAPLASKSQTVVNSSTFRTTYWGMKGSEDLGGGLKANFNLMSAFAIDDGAGDKNGTFARTASVGLSGGFGNVILGRQYTPYYDLFGVVESINNGNASPSETVYGLGIKQGITRASNSVGYTSPSFSGVTVSALAGLGEDAQTTGNLGGSATNTYSLNVIYKAGPLLVGFGHHEETLEQNTVGVQQDKNKYNMIGGTYDFGVAKVNAGYQKVSNDTGRDDKEYNLGVTVPVSSAIKVYLGYADSNTTASGFELNGNGYNLLATYDLSKRTYLYTSYDRTSLEKGTVGAVSTDVSSRLIAGVVHLF